MQGAIGVLAVVLVVVCACGARSGPSEATRKMQQFSASMCTCTDLACAENVNREMVAWAESAHAQPTREEREETAKYAERYASCMQKHTAAADTDAAPAEGAGAVPAAGSATPTEHR